ncbi:preprotein translocase subunit SecE [Myxococcota bacterium]|nr:preprotein translocase subunit SecE [Myxococcota bacterium]
MEWSPAVWVSDSRQFAREVIVEAKKITWPTQKEAVAGTIGVVVIVAIITTALSLVDALLGQLIQWILPGG